MICANIKVNGIVQGVGFRPFIHKLAKEGGLRGWIRNTNCGAEIEIEGSGEQIDFFISRIKSDHPPLAEIGSICVIYSDKLTGYSSFDIIESEASGNMDTLISPDIGICSECKAELSDMNDRRYRYPFINCTNCGPRFTIIKTTPYDRKNTTMSDFKMCPDCKAEYHDIYNRRYHAQPDCCHVCGPELAFYDGNGDELQCDPIEKAAELLQNGMIIAVKGLGGFHLACRADDPEAAARLRKRKQRDERPLALMCRDISEAEQYARVTEDEKKTLESFRKPIVLLEKKDLNAYSYLSENGYIGVMLPYTPIHCLLMKKTGTLIMTSANLSDKPIIYRNDEALTELKGIADGFLLHNREIEARCDDSLLWVRDGKDYPVRRSRGYVPYPVRLRFETDADGLLACGAEQKASFALAKGNMVFPGQHIGDLKNIETFDNYESQIKHFENLFRVDVKQIVCDMHPDYMSTEYAIRRSENEDLPLLQLQHHYAHMVSCMADNGITEKCIGIVWDGSGYGTDGTIWGGEFLTGDLDGFQRRGRIRPIRLPGGDKAVKEIWRCAVSILEDAGIDSRDFYPDQDTDTVRKMLKSDINCPVSSGMGRLFDAVASICNIKQKVSYEGQGAVLLEAAAADSDGIYSYDIISDKIYEFDTRPMVHCIIKNTIEGRSRGLIAADFMNTLCAMAADICTGIRDDEGLNRIVLSGGSFQNMYILKKLSQMLMERSFEVYRHRRVSTNDEGISFGQAAVAAWRRR